MLNARIAAIAAISIATIFACSMQTFTHPMLILTNEPGGGHTNVGSSMFACKIARNVVAVYEQNVWKGSGVALNTNTILTAYHVVNGDPVFTIRSHYCNNGDITEGAAYPAMLLYFEPAADLAWLGVTNPLTDGLPIAPIQTGSSVWVYSAARWGARGTVALRDEHHALVDGLVRGGVSGGAVLDADGHLVGIVLARMVESRRYIMRLPRRM